MTSIIKDDLLMANSNHSRMSLVRCLLWVMPMEDYLAIRWRLYLGGHRPAAIIPVGDADFAGWFNNEGAEATVIRRWAVARVLWDSRAHRP